MNHEFIKNDYNEFMGSFFTNEDLNFFKNFSAKNFEESLANTSSILNDSPQSSISTIQTISSSPLSDHCFDYKSVLREIYPQAGTSKKAQKIPTEMIIAEEPTILLNEVEKNHVTQNFDETIKSITIFSIPRNENDFKKIMNQCMVDIKCLIHDFQLYEKVAEWQLDLLFPGREKIVLEDDIQFIRRMDKCFSETFRLLQQLNEKCFDLNFFEEKRDIEAIIDELVKKSCIFLEHPQQLFKMKDKRYTHFHDESQ